MSSSSLITHLRHIDIAMPDFAEQRRFYTELWGLTETAGDTRVSFLAAEGSPEQYVVRLREDARKRTGLIAFGAAGADDVDALAARLTAGGVRLVHEPKPLDARGGGYGVRFFDIDEFMRGTGRMRRLGIERLWGPGRHRAGDNALSYFLDRAGNTVEYTTELEVLDEDTGHPHLYDLRDPANADQWGTANERDEFIAAKSHNHPDPGLFDAPPM
ncbi:VOC family protein [Streptomyces roseoverticillatus]|uniref:VOC family protein n=1 Tax=Streptomyces roseoverticillatus TaxID=66429 RepID=UPI001F4818B2|nr:VOC family protein [Streptomyces roseoverticillatus]MCF3106885.1 VOC family protein [Streptomyces roseoverticillatus]